MDYERYVGDIVWCLHWVRLGVSHDSCRLVLERDELWAAQCSIDMVITYMVKDAKQVLKQDSRATDLNIRINNSVWLPPQTSS